MADSKRHILMKADNLQKLEILYQASGRFDRRFPVGPACWPHFDLLWVQEGAVRLKVAAQQKVLELRAPMGVLIFPNVPFQGVAIGPVAAASVCHFTGGPFAANLDGVTHILSGKDEGFHLHNLIRLSLAYVDRGAQSDVRKRLLRSILDCFAQVGRGAVDLGRLDHAWAYASARLKDIRSLQDVAAGIGLSESAFRTLHRQQFPMSAGRHLLEMRLQKAEQLLSTTGLSINEVSVAIGYAHAESFSAAFSRSRGKTPSAYRRWCKRLA